MDKTIDSEDEQIKAYMRALGVTKGEDLWFQKSKDGTITIKLNLDICTAPKSEALLAPVYNTDWEPIMPNRYDASRNVAGTTIATDFNDTLTITIPPGSRQETLAFLNKNAGNVLARASFQKDLVSVKSPDLSNLNEVEQAKSKLASILADAKVAQKKGKLKQSDVAILQTQYDKLVAPLNQVILADHLHKQIEAIAIRPNTTLAEIEASDADVKAIFELVSQAATTKTLSQSQIDSIIDKLSELTEELDSIHKEAKYEKQLAGETNEALAEKIKAVYGLIDCTVSSNPHGNGVTITSSQGFPTNLLVDIKKAGGVSNGPVGVSLNDSALREYVGFLNSDEFKARIVQKAQLTTQQQASNVKNYHTLLQGVGSKVSDNMDQIMRRNQILQNIWRDINDALHKDQISVVQFDALKSEYQQYNNSIKAAAAAIVAKETSDEIGKLVISVIEKSRSDKLSDLFSAKQEMQKINQMLTTAVNRDGMDAGEVAEIKSACNVPFTQINQKVKDHVEGLKKMIENASQDVSIDDEGKPKEGMISLCNIRYFEDGKPNSPTDKGIARIELLNLRMSDEMVKSIKENGGKIKTQKSDGNLIYTIDIPEAGLANLDREQKLSEKLSSLREEDYEQYEKAKMPQTGVIPELKKAEELKYLAAQRENTFSMIMLKSQSKNLADSDHS